MKNIILKIEYDGTNYHGWQTQRLKTASAKQTVKTIQETIEKVLKKILREKIKIFASGRTDAGVHARGQMANFKTAKKIPLKKIKTALNSLLPPDIRIKSISRISNDFHARYSAKSKVYRYTILNQSDNHVFTRNYAMHVLKPLNVALMQREAKVLLGKRDFKSFQASDKRQGKSIRTMKKIRIKKQNNFVFVDFEADGFLYNMVRNIVGTLVKIGKGKLPAGSLKKILALKNRKYAGPPAPAKGLCLEKVKY